jgi:phosphoribosylpyrophosphate synthetase
MPFYLVMLTKNREIAINELIVTDSIPLKKESNKIRVLSCAPLLRSYAHGAPQQFH